MPAKSQSWHHRTQIVVARHSAFITGVDEATKEELMKYFYRHPSVSRVI